jgi:2-polyprenyl-3-methyl-5-hydroxy-6-metoxy-1,4-benzoquinol methylase
MDKNTQTRLLEINQQFYDQYASSFSLTRHQAQPGVRLIAQGIDPHAAVLDVGCGNGTLAHALNAQGFSGTYLGVDMSAGLLKNARKLLNVPLPAIYDFRLVDLSQKDWTDHIHRRTYDWLVSFAVLHHLPGQDLRQQTIKEFSEFVSQQSLIAVSVWQWQNSPRLRKKILPWSSVGLDAKEVDDGDVLLDWRAGHTPGIRYVHTFTEESLTQLAQSAGFKVVEAFYSDGKTGDLALYQVWQPG